MRYLFQIILPAAMLFFHATTSQAMMFVFYVATTGDDNNFCNSPQAPCRTIEAALDKAGSNVDWWTIKIARGTYQENTMSIQAERKIKLSGGWSDDFSSQTCEFSNTVIIPPAGVTNSLLLGMNIDGFPAKASLSLRCLTLNGNGENDSEAIFAQATHGAEVDLELDQVRCTGFTGNSFRFFSSDGGGGIVMSLLSVTIRDTTLDHNPGNLDDSTYGIWLGVYDNSEASLQLDRVVSADNGPWRDYRQLNVQVTDSGQGDVNIKNSIFSHRYATHESVIASNSNTNGTLNLSLTNTTVHGVNSRPLTLLSAGSSTTSVKLTNAIVPADSIGVPIDLFQRNTASLDFSADYSILGEHHINADDPNKVTWTSHHEVSGDPMLDATGHLKQGSPAIDAGICGFKGITYHRIAPYGDIDGDKRPGYGTLLGCDIGADEYYPFPWSAFLPAILPHQ